MPPFFVYYWANDVEQDLREFLDMVDFLWEACEQRDMQDIPDANNYVSRIFREIIGFTRFEFGKYRDFIATSLFVMLVAYLENQLKELASAVDEMMEPGCEDRYQKKKMPYIKTAKTYLADKVGTIYSREDDEYIDTIVDIRNNIAHMLLSHDNSHTNTIHNIDRDQIVKLCTFALGLLTRVIDDIFEKYPDAVYLEIED